MTRASDSPATAGLTQRLHAVRSVLGVRTPPDAEAPAYDLLEEIVSALGTSPDDASSWLLTAALTGSMPEHGLVRSVTRALTLKSIDESLMWLLGAMAPMAAGTGNATATLRLVTDRPFVDAHFAAGSDFLTGIQRVVRGVVSQWHDQHAVELVGWSDRGGAFRTLDDVERARLLRAEVPRFDPRTRRAAGSVTEILVPWGVPVVLLEVPTPQSSGRLAALAELTASSVRLIGYDCIPIASAETVPLAEAEKFGHYLELVKHADRVAGISRTAAEEFRGFASSLVAQGLAGPLITACPLPHTIPMAGATEIAAVTPTAGSGAGSDTGSGRPVVACVGTVGRRKNQASLIAAAEMLWREGVDFELRILGHLAAERSPLTGLVPELVEAGRPLVVESGVSDARIAETLEHARCLVFPTLHEGFGLPIVEALSHGVPVVTSDFGSTREVAEDQGGILVDPEDVPALASTLRALLEDDELHARLVEDARRRPQRSWSEYAADLWKALVA